MMYVSPMPQATIAIRSSIQQASIETLASPDAAPIPMIFSENVTDATNTATSKVRNDFARSFDSE